MQDRVSLFPGRVKLEPVAGETNLYDLTRADQPTQEGTAINKTNLLKDSTAALLGLGTSAVPDDAFLVLALGSGYYGYRVKVQLADGTPVEGSTVSGLSALPGSSLVTGADGIVVGRSTSSSVTIGCSSPYIDQKPPEAQAVTKTGMITDATLTLSNNTEMQTITSSKTTRISPLAKTLDITAVGGGGGGGGKLDWEAVSNYRIGYTQSGGGGGGYAETVMAHPLSNNKNDKKIDITVGSGGRAGGYVYSESASDLYGGDGGTTAVKIDDTAACTANGGKGGHGGKSTSDPPLGGDGNGAGGCGAYGESPSHDGEPGIAGSKYIFDEQSLGLAGGGGGGGGFLGGYNHPNPGGLPNGGEGYNASNRAEAGTPMGGGGGGGSNKNTDTSGRGGAGGVYLRFHF